MQSASASLVSESQFGQCVSGVAFTTPECASGSFVNVRVVLIL